MVYVLAVQGAPKVNVSWHGGAWHAAVNMGGFTAWVPLKDMGAELGNQSRVLHLKEGLSEVLPRVPALPALPSYAIISAEELQRLSRLVPGSLLANRLMVLALGRQPSLPLSCEDLEHLYALTVR